VGKESGAAKGPNVEPHRGGTLRLPSRAWKDGDVVNLKFYRLGDLLVDEYNLPVNPPPHVLPPPRGPAPAVREEPDSLLISGADFNLVFSKQTGLITRGSYKGTDIIESGPYLRLGGGRELPEWSLKRIAAGTEANEAVVDLSGSYGPTAVSFQLRIDGSGLITTKYTLDAVPDLDRKLVWGGYFYYDAGGYWEVGVSYNLTQEVDRLAWHRKGMWSAYPEDHIGRNIGLANREGKGANGRYLEAPGWSWAEDERNYFQFGRYDLGGRGTNDFRSMKSNIYYASAIVRQSQNRIQAESDGNDAVRLEVLDDARSLIGARDPRVKLTGSWTQSETGIRGERAGDSAELAFNGTGVCWLAVPEQSGGAADVYIDGRREAAGVNLYVPRRSEDSVRRSMEIQYCKEGLPNGPHTIRVAVAVTNRGGPARALAPPARTTRAGSAAAGAFVPVDAFKVYDGQTKGAIRFIIANEWNYPQLSWGNYVKDQILVKSGYKNQVRMRFSDRD
jgi:hypothetical protein